MVVVVPIYKNELNAFEMISLKQLKRVLGDYPIVVVKPEHLVLDGVLRSFCDSVICFDDYFFKSTATYSKLVLSSVFYEKFLKYHYLLVYQTDAFVFSDRLEEFCLLGYDYIGAIAPNYYWHFLDNKVGNGGFSLRRVTAFLDMIEHKENILDRAKDELKPCDFRQLQNNEDQFVAYASQVLKNEFRVADRKTASRFAVEYNVEGLYERMKEPPFGTHRWYKENFDFWWPIIKSFGYDADIESIKKYTERGSIFEKNSLYKYVSNSPRDTRIRVLLEGRLPQKEQYYLRGGGELGIKCMTLLKTYGYTIAGVIDSKLKSSENELRTIDPSEIDYNSIDGKIIVASIKYEYEIQQELEKEGLVENRDYYLWTDIEYAMIKLMDFRLI